MHLALQDDVSNRHKKLLTPQSAEPCQELGMEKRADNKGLTHTPYQKVPSLCGELNRRGDNVAWLGQGEPLKGGDAGAETGAET